MKSLLNKRVSIAWLLIVISGLTAAIVLWQVAVVNAPPQNAVLIVPADRSSAFVTPSPQVARQTAQPIKEAPEGTATTVAVALYSPTPLLIAVYISGAVAKPGVYLLPEGSRIGDAVQAAGGPSAEANIEAVNLAARVSDEQHITVPRQGETPVAAAQKPTGRPSHATATPATAQRVNGKVDLNTATAKELESLPGIGEVLAGRIVEYRNANGPFKAIEDIMNVAGIKEAVFAQIRDLVTVSGH
jgi:competence protein ComEA